MVHSVYSKRMSEHQISLIEQALRQLSKIAPVGWGEIPTDLHVSFSRYMCMDAWTGLPDLMTLREAALMIICDALTHRGEFTDDE
jgi:hypothetical protein